MPSNNDGYNRGYGFPGFGGPGYGGPDDEMRCSFCHKTRSQVNKLIAGQDGVCICDECLQACMDMMGQGAADDEFYHYDTPLTLAHELEALREAGFADVQVLNRWAATGCIRAAK